MALNSECFPGFTERDLQYFRFIDVRDKDYEDWSNPEFFRDKKRTNAKKDALYAALAVLSKSAAALLVSRHLHSVPGNWRIQLFRTSVPPQWILISYWGTQNRLILASRHGYANWKREIGSLCTKWMMYWCIFSSGSLEIGPFSPVCRTLLITRSGFYLKGGTLTS